MKKNVFMAAAAAFVMAACGSQKSVSDLSSLNGEWDIIEVEGKKINAADCESAPFLGFDAKKHNLYGNTGCNSLTGSLNANAKKGTIDFSNTGTTMMLCADMETERRVLDALKKSHKFSIPSTGKLTLNDNSGNTVIVLQKKK